MKDGGPAFPYGVEVRKRDGYSGEEYTFEENETGMSLRDYFAAKAMQGYVGCAEVVSLTDKDYARRAYKIADAMLEEREKSAGT